MAVKNHDTAGGKFLHPFSLRIKYDSFAVSYLQMLEERHGNNAHECNVISPGDQMS